MFSFSVPTAPTTSTIHTAPHIRTVAIGVACGEYFSIRPSSSFAVKGIRGRGALVRLGLLVPSESFPFVRPTASRWSEFEMGSFVRRPWL
jgi:hypothetical protein